MKNNDLIFWAAYIPDGDKKKYLSDGRGNLRLFKTEDALREHIKPLLSSEDYARVVVHEVQGKIAVPVEDVKPDKPVLITPLTPAASLPTAAEMLANYKKRHGIK